MLRSVVMKHLRLASVLFVWLAFSSAFADSYYRLAVLQCDSEGFDLKFIGTYDGAEKLPGSKGYQAEALHQRLRKSLKVIDGDRTYFAMEPAKRARLELSCAVGQARWSFELGLHPPSPSGHCGGEPHADLTLKKDGEIVFQDYPFAACGSAAQSLDGISLKKGKSQIKCRGDLEKLLKPAGKELLPVKCEQVEL